MKKKIVMTIVAVVLGSLLTPAVGAEGGPLGLKGISPGWYSGMAVVIDQDAPVFADPKSQRVIGQTEEVSTGAIAVLKPNYTYHRPTNQWVACAPLLRVNGRVPVVPTGNGLDYWRGMGWVEESRIIPQKAYQGEFDGPRQKPPFEPSLYTTCSSTQG